MVTPLFVSDTGAESTHPARVRTNRAERSTALSARRRSAAVRLRGDRRALSCVPDRSLVKATCQTTEDYRPEVAQRLPMFRCVIESGRITGSPEAIPR
jgi:hypothetical protein